MFEFILDLLVVSAKGVWLTFLHNWPFLLFSILIAVLLKLYVNADRLSAFLTRYGKASIFASTAAAVATPFCSCGTTAVMLGMLASRIPWAPVVAFMVASPLTSPEELVYSAGLFGWPFAWAFFISSILLGLAGGLLASLLDNRGWLAGQARFADKEPAKPSKPAARQADPKAIQAAGLPSSSLIPLSLFATQACCASELPVAFQPLPATIASSACSCSVAAQTPAQPTSVGSCASASCSGAVQPRPSWRVFLNEFRVVGLRLLAMFTGFAFIGYFINGLIPASWISRLFGSGNLYSVPLAATLGLPFYLNTEATLPLIRALLDAGMSSGAALAFMIAGAGTSIGAIAGALTIARWRVVALVVAILWIGAMLCGFGYDFLAVILP
jgi:uncharacterized membrane protein YraQ (UPF0718 family)